MFPPGVPLCEQDDFLHDPPQSSPQGAKREEPTEGENVEECDVNVKVGNPVAQSSDASMTLESPSATLHDGVAGSRSSLSAILSDGSRSKKPLVSPIEVSSPRLKKSLSSQTESPSPKSKKSLSFPMENSSPDSKQAPSVLPAGVSSPKLMKSRTASVEDSSPKSSKRREGKDGSQKRKRSGKRKRGLSTSSSDDPKSSRSRTESGGSELMCELFPNDQEPPSAEGDATETNVQQPMSKALIAGQKSTVAFDDEKSRSDTSRVLFDIQTLTSPPETSSPIVKDKKSHRKKEGKKKGEGSQKKHGSGRRKRGLSTSSSEDPKSSRSQTESLVFENSVAGQQLPSVSLECSTVKTQSPETSFPSISKTDDKSTAVQTTECYVHVTDFDNSVADFSEC